MAGGAPIREPIIDRKTGRLTPVWERYFTKTLQPDTESELNVNVGSDYSSVIKLDSQIGSEEFLQRVNDLPPTDIEKLLYSVVQSQQKTIINQESAYSDVIHNLSNSGLAPWRCPPNGDNYAEIEADGTIVLHGDAIVYDDLRVSPNSLPELGAQAPEHKIISNDGEGGTTGDAIGFNGTSQYATLPDNAELDAIGDASFSFWLEPHGSQGTIAFRDSYIRFRKSFSSLVISLDNSWEMFIPNVLVEDANHHIGISLDGIGSNTRVKVRINNVEVYNSIIWGYTLAAQATDFIIGYNGISDYLHGDVDEFHMYNVILTEAQWIEIWNSGDGISSVPSGVTEATELVFRFHFDEPNKTDNDSTLGAGHDLTLTGTPPSEDPLVTFAGTAGSFGVAVLSFPAGQTTQVFFTAQIPHTYLEGSDIEPHVHWLHETANSGDVVWGLEYMWVNVNDSQTDTTLIENAMTVSTQGVHHANNISTITGTGKKISSILVCRLYRKGDSASDTFPDEVFLSEFDFHFQINTHGSRTKWVK